MMKENKKNGKTKVIKTTSQQTEEPEANQEEPQRESQTETQVPKVETQTDNPEIPKPKKPLNKLKIVQNLVFIFIFAITSVFMFWTNKISSVDNSTLIMIITFSVLANVFILLIVFGTGIGIELTKRFLNKFKYKSGNYVNSLHLMKSGVIKERFKKKDPETGSFRMISKPYVTNPKLKLIYNGIPSYIHREGNPDPLDVWGADLTGNLSNSEMDIAMNSKGAFDVKAWLEKNKTIILLGLLVVIGVGCAAAFFGYSSYQMLRDGTFQQVTSVACNNLPEPAQIVEKVLGGV